MISSDDKVLLLRVARRLEEAADKDFEGVKKTNPGAIELDLAKRLRNRVLGDARDVRAYVERAGVDKDYEARVLAIMDEKIAALRETDPEKIMLGVMRDRIAELSA